MLSFSDFIATFSSLSVLENSNCAKYIYENIIARDDVRIKMVLASEAGLPALSACAREIEEYCDSVTNCDLDLNNKTVKQSVGRMVKAALTPLGYHVCAQGGVLSSSLELRYFRTASSYSREGTSLKISVSTLTPDGGVSLSCDL